jgi:hypothetical protein
MEKADEMEGSSVILGEQNIVHNGEIFIQDQLTTVDFNNDEDQTSKFKDVEWNDDSDCGYEDNSEVENDFSDSSVKPSAKHIKTKSNKKYKNVVDEDDDRSKNCKSENSRFSQISSTEPQGEPELQQFWRLSSLNSEECSSTTAIDVSIKNTNKKNQKKAIRLKTKIWQCWCSILVSWYFHHLSTS